MDALFDPQAPLDMLRLTHYRIERQCDALRQLVQHVAEHGPDARAQRAALQGIRFFDVAARHCHADEEEDVFPALLESMAGSDAVCLHELTRDFAADHRRLEAAWPRLRAALVDVATGDPSSLLPSQVTYFAEGYRRHMQLEDSELWPMAARLLDGGELQRIGQAMARRRRIQ